MAIGIAEETRRAQLRMRLAQEALIAMFEQACESMGRAKQLNRQPTAQQRRNALTLAQILSNGTYAEGGGSVLSQTPPPGGY